MKAAHGRQWPAVALTIGSRVAIIAVGLTTSIITARALGAEGRGEYFAVMTLAGIIAQFSNVGLSSSNTLLAARDSACSDRLLANSVWVSVACWLVGVAVVVASGTRLSERLSVEPLALLMSVTLAPCILFQTLGSSLLVAGERFGVLNAWLVGNAFAAVGLMAVCAWLHVGPVGFLMATTAAAAATALGIWFSARQPGPAIGLFDLSLFRSGLSFAARAYVAVLAGFLMQRVAASVMIAHGDLRALGIFSVSSQVYDVLMILPGSAALVLFPRLVKDQHNSWRTTRGVLVTTSVLMLLACALAVGFGGIILPLVFGPPFAASVAPTVALLPAALCMSAVAIMSQMLVARLYPMSLVLIWAGGLAATLAFAVVLYPRFGVVGVAAAQSLGAVAVFAGVVTLTAVRLRSAGDHRGGVVA